MTYIVGEHGGQNGPGMLFLCPPGLPERALSVCSLFPSHFPDPNYLTSSLIGLAAEIQLKFL